MNSYSTRAMVVILLFMVTACSLPWQNRSPQTEDELGARSADEMPNFPGESKRLTPGRGASRASSGPSLKAEGKHLQDMESLLNEALASFQRSQDFWRKGDSNNAISALDKAYHLILQVNPEGDQDLTQQKEKIRLMICRRMVEIYATQHRTAKGPEKAIPLVLNRYVEREIRLFKGPERKVFLEAYKRSGRYRPMIQAAMEKVGLPKELSWLPLIESEFRAVAFSPARALGLWQFIPSTGYKFGLKRDHWLDERMDAEKSTRAAIAYLQELHNIFGDWYTVLAAYNCGEGRVLEVIRTQRINYLDNFWDLFARLPQETARYVPRFIATLHIIHNPGILGFTLEEPHPPIPFESVKVSKSVPLKEVAKFLSVSSETIEALNPELRFKMTPPGPYDLKVPEGKGNLLLAKLNGKQVSLVSPKPYSFHRVQWGESLTELAGLYRTSVQAITDLNHIKEKDFLRVGQELKIPRGEAEVSKETRTEIEEVTPSKPNPLRYRVKRGDTLWKIAERYQTNLYEIMSLNRLENTYLQIDQELFIPPGK